MIDQDRGYTPTPVLSHAILTYNRPPGRLPPQAGSSLGIVITAVAPIRRMTAASATIRRTAK